MFTISTELHRQLVLVKVTGMLTLEQVADFYRAEHEAIRGMGCPLGQQIAIVDVSECPLQLQQIVEAFQKSMESPARAKRLAMVTGGSLSRTQARRILKRDNAALFETVAEAEAWLFADPIARAA